MAHIALVDDESSILISVSLALKSDGFTVDTYPNGEEAFLGLESKKYDLGLFDIKMPRMNGSELLMKIRSSHNLSLKNMPVIFLTSKDQEQDEIIGLKMGAADYIKKPFSQKLLNERIRTVLRIYENRNSENTLEKIDKKIIEKGDLYLDGPKQLCFWKKHAIELTVAEYGLVESLAKNPGIIKTRNQLMDAMYGDNIYVDDRTIDSHIKRLRKKFKFHDSEFDQIRTRYGSGYSWRE
jgi:two-component system response regulator ChvI